MRFYVSVKHLIIVFLFCKRSFADCNESESAERKLSPPKVKVVQKFKPHAHANASQYFAI